jgi:hypothetical protein
MFDGAAKCMKNQPGKTCEVVSGFKTLKIKDTVMVYPPGGSCEKDSVTMQKMSLKKESITGGYTVITMCGNIK